MDAELTCVAGIAGRGCHASMIVIVLWVRRLAPRPAAERRKLIIMSSRVDVTKYPDAVKAMYGLERIARERGIERKLLHLIKTRVSQINGCAYCVDMHTKDARAEGETEQRLYGLSAWQETPFYTPRERAALEWAETLTLIASHHVPDELYARTREHFTEAELVGLTLAVIAINGWNRVAIPFRVEVGSYQPGTVAEAAATAHA
jgi:AhpD family alkylhydroperoxidase